LVFLGISIELSQELTTDITITRIRFYRYCEIAIDTSNVDNGISDLIGEE
jgi:hypothetical protein